MYQVRFRTYVGALLCMLCCWARVDAQGCPPNIGFEKASFVNWETLSGRADSARGILLNNSYPDADRHRIYLNTSTGEKDLFGGFPVNCPNGSGASIKLGNATGGAMAEGMNYTFKIPSDKNTFSLIYYYAVVMQNPPHASNEQPKFTAKVYNVNTNEYITCSSFEYIAQAGLPGFESSTRDGTVLFKAWTPVTIKLSGYAGNTIRLEFATNDCTRGGHFGYAYVDVDENCLSPVRGNIICQYDSVLNLTAPYGFQDYRWFNKDFSQFLGGGPTYNRPVIPPDNTEYAVELTPFPNQGCLDTVFTKIHYSTENIVLNTTQNIVSGCENQGINLDKLVAGMGNSPDLIYSFYYDAALTRHVFTTDSITTSGTYYIKGLNEDGCFLSQPVNIVVNPVPNYSSLIPSGSFFRPATLDLTAALSAPGNTFSYWKDALATIPVSNPNMVDKDGTYYIKVTTAEGCSSITAVTALFINPNPTVPNVFSPNGDGVNDYWAIGNMIYYPDAIVNIYTRTGQTVYHSSGYGKPWDGKQNGNDLPVGTYYYVIQLTKSHPPIGGSVTILR